MVIPASATDLAIDGDPLYVAAGGSGLAIHDLDDECAPRVLACVNDHRSCRVLDDSSTVAPRDFSWIRFDNLGDRVRLHGKQLIIYDRRDVQLLDVSNPHAPRLAKVWQSQASPPSNAAFFPDTI